MVSIKWLKVYVLKHIASSTHFMRKSPCPWWARNLWGRKAVSVLLPLCSCVLSVLWSAETPPCHWHWLVATDIWCKQWAVTPENTPSSVICFKFCNADGAVGDTRDHNSWWMQLNRQLVSIQHNQLGMSWGWTEMCEYNSIIRIKYRHALKGI